MEMVTTRSTGPVSMEVRDDDGSLLGHLQLTPQGRWQIARPGEDFVGAFVGRPAAIAALVELAAPPAPGPSWGDVAEAERKRTALAEAVERVRAYVGEDDGTDWAVDDLGDLMASDLYLILDAFPKPDTVTS